MAKRPKLTPYQRRALMCEYEKGGTVKILCFEYKITLSAFSRLLKDWIKYKKLAKKFADLGSF